MFGQGDDGYHCRRHGDGSFRRRAEMRTKHSEIQSRKTGKEKKMTELFETKRKKEMIRRMNKK